MSAEHTIIGGVVSFAQGFAQSREGPQIEAMLSLIPALGANSVWSTSRHWSSVKLNVVGVLAGKPLISSHLIPYKPVDPSGPIEPELGSDTIRLLFVSKVQSSIIKWLSAGGVPSHSRV